MYFLFNTAQVDGWKEPNRWPGGLIGRDENVELFIAATGADIRLGDTAAYSRSADYISIPSAERFVGTKTSSTTESYYATIFHELVHWTGHHTRLARNLSSRFGTSDYAMEELIAELGAAYLCAEYLVLNTPRPDHAAYIGEWLEVLKGDKRAIFIAAAKANEAVTWLLSS
jgi:antirestriction protein ArdC